MLQIVVEDLVRAEHPRSRKPEGQILGGKLLGDEVVVSDNVVGVVCDAIRAEKCPRAARRVIVLGFPIDIQTGLDSSGKKKIFQEWAARAINRSGLQRPEATHSLD